MALIWKKGYFWPTFYIFNLLYQGKALLTLLNFFALKILKKVRIYQVWFLFSMIPGVDSHSRHFGTINK